ncbi:MAG: hypothetical protein J6L61_06105 [Ruminiclostridium sp.]|nr:hypothetical protein [Ruminiclostridium sp.]
MSMKRRSRNGAFLVELLIVIAVFAVCAAACVRVVGIAASEMRYAERLSDAQIKTADIAECYKSGTDIAELEKLYTDGDVEIKLSERIDGSMQYLDITAYDSKYTYITITSARRADLE